MWLKGSPVGAVPLLSLACRITRGNLAVSSCSRCGVTARDVLAAWRGEHTTSAPGALGEGSQQLPLFLLGLMLPPHLSTETSCGAVLLPRMCLVPWQEKFPLRG